MDINDDNTTWRVEITETMKESGESWEDVVQTTLTDEEMDRVFDGGFGSVCGCAFTLWTKERVYFPMSYDGAEYVKSVPRNPCDERVGHI